MNKRNYNLRTVSDAFERCLSQRSVHLREVSVLVRCLSQRMSICLKDAHHRKMSICREELKRCTS